MEKAILVAIAKMKNTGLKPAYLNIHPDDLTTEVLDAIRPYNIQVITSFMVPSGQAAVSEKEDISRQGALEKHEFSGNYPRRF